MKLVPFETHNDDGLKCFNMNPENYFTGLWCGKVVTFHFNLILAIIYAIVSPAEAQIGTYTLDLNSKASEGITVFLFQVCLFSVLTSSS